MSDLLAKLAAPVLGCCSLLIGIAMLGYALHGIAAGEIRLASRTTNSIVSLLANPRGFFIGVGLFFFGGLFMLWCGIVVLRSK